MDSLISRCWYRAGGSFLLSKREAGTVGRKERNVIGDDCTWSIEPTNEERLLEVIRKVDLFFSLSFLFFLISRHLYDAVILLRFDTEKIVIPFRNIEIEYNTR